MSPSAFSSTLTIDAQISEARANSEAGVDKIGEDEDDSDIDYDKRITLLLMMICKKAVMKVMMTMIVIISS